MTLLVQETFGNFWGHSSLSQGGKKKLILAHCGQEPGMLLCILHHKGHCSTVYSYAHMSCVPRLREACSIATWMWTLSLKRPPLAYSCMLSVWMATCCVLMEQRMKNSNTTALVWVSQLSLTAFLASAMELTLKCFPCLHAPGLHLTNLYRVKVFRVVGFSDVFIN